MVIEGVVRDARGNAQSGVAIAAIPVGSKSSEFDGFRHAARSDSEGRFRIEGLEAGRWRLVSPPQVATDLPTIEEREVDAGATGVAVVLSGGYR